MEVINNLKFNKEGLIPAIAQQWDSGEVLMMAWMNIDAIEESLKTGRVCYYSRSRSKLWRKGESSGQVQHLRKCCLIVMAILYSLKLTRKELPAIQAEEVVFLIPLTKTRLL